MSRALLVIILFLLSTCNIFAKHDKSAAVTLLENLQKEYNAVSIAVTVVKDGTIDFSHAVGVQDIETNLPASNNNLYRIASVTKTFTATGVLQLVESGKVSLEDDVSELVGFSVRNPRFPEKVITLRMLLNHTSSLTDDAGYFTLDHINPQVTQDVSGSFTTYAPGEHFNYCDLNFNLCGAIIEKISGERIDNYFQKHFFGPLDIDAGFNVDSLDSKRFATLYRWVDSLKTYHPSPDAYRSLSEKMSEYRLGYDAPMFSASAGIKISSEDLAKVAIMHMNYGNYNGVRILSEGMSRTMQADSLGCGTFYDYIKGVKMIGHNGGAYGLKSLMIFSPEQKCGIVIFVSGSHGIDNLIIPRLASGLYDALIR